MEFFVNVSRSGRIRKLIYFFKNGKEERDKIKKRTYSALTSSVYFGLKAKQNPCSLYTGWKCSQHFISSSRYLHTSNVSLQCTAIYIDIFFKLKNGPG